MTDNRKYIALVIISACLLASSLGLNINVLGVFLATVSGDLGIRLGDFSVHSTLISIGLALGSFIIPGVVRRFNFRLVVLIATTVVALTTLGMSFSTEAWQFNVLGLLRGIATSFFGIVPVQLLINNWFHDKHGLVTSIVFSFSGVAGALFSPILSGVIESQGWQTAYVVKAVLFVALSLPALLIPFKFTPEDEGMKPYGADKVALNTNENQNVPVEGLDSVMNLSFVLLIVSSILITALTGFAQHLSAVGALNGFSASIGALMISACMIGNIVFKLLIGILSDMKGPRLAVIAAASIIILGLSSIYIGGNIPLLIIGSFLFGGVYSVTSLGITLITKQVFTPRAFIKVFPTINFVANLGAAFAVSLYGYSYDFSGSYNPAIIFSIIASVIVIINVVIVTRNKQNAVTTPES